MLSQERRMFTSSVYWTRTPAALYPVDPSAGDVRASSTITVNPCSLKRKAQDAPIMPAPTINTSVFLLIDMLARLSSSVQEFCLSIPLLRGAQSSCCRFINHIEMGRSHHLLLAPHVANDHAILAQSR